MPNVQVDGTLNVEGEVFIPSGATLSGVVEKVASTNNAIVRFDGTNGEVQDSGAYITDIGNLLVGTTTDNGVDKLQINGSVNINGVQEFRQNVPMSGNVQYVFKIVLGYDTSTEITALAAHYGLAPYGANRKSIVNTGNGGTNVIDIINTSSGNFGSWNIERISGVEVHLIKTAGTYNGGANALISVSNAISVSLIA